MNIPLPTPKHSSWKLKAWWKLTSIHHPPKRPKNECWLHVSRQNNRIPEMLKMFQRWILWIHGSLSNFMSCFKTFPFPPPRQKRTNTFDSSGWFQPRPQNGIRDGWVGDRPQDHLKHVGFEAPVANATLPKLPEAPKVMVGSPPPDGYRFQETNGYEHILPNGSKREVWENHHSSKCAF